MKRRTFIAGLGSAAAWPVVARAQQGDRVRRIGVLMPYDENEPVAKTEVSAFTQALANFGWTDGRNVRIELRWYGDDINRARALAHHRDRRDRGDPCRPAGDADDPDRLCGRGRSSRQRHRRSARPPERERHRLRQLSLAGRQVA